MRVVAIHLLCHAAQAITAIIVNSHAKYYIKNQRGAYQKRRADTKLQWWGTARTHDDPLPGTGDACDGGDDCAALRQYGRG